MAKQLELFDQVGRRLTWNKEVVLKPNVNVMRRIFGNLLTDYIIQVRVHETPWMINPITDTERARMYYPSAMGPLESALYDAGLSVITNNCEPEFVFDAKFDKGKYVFGGEYAGAGVPNNHCLGKDLYSPKDFLVEISKRYKVSPAEFQQFFGDAPQIQQNAVRELLETRVN